MKALITGSTGFIGKHLVRFLSERGHEAVCLVRETSDRSELEGLDGVSFAVGDMLDPASLVDAVADVDAVFHLAALLRVPWRSDFLTVNADGARNVAAACAAEPRPPVLVAVSSLAAGGAVETPAPRTEADRPAPVSRYGRAKLMAEEAAASYADRVPTSIVRPPIVIGPGDKAAFSLFRMAANGRFLTPTRREQRMSVVSVQHLARVLLAVAERGERLPSDELGANGGQGIYYAAADETPEIGELGQLLGDAVGNPKVRVHRTPKALTRAVGVLGEAFARTTGRPARFTRDKAREATAGHWLCSPVKVRTELGLAHEPLEAALATTAGWYREQGWL